MMLKIRTVKDSVIVNYLNRKQTLEEISRELEKDGYFNYIPSNEETLNWMFGDVNPYYKRRVDRRLCMMKVLDLAKENGCEVYITPFESMYDYGFIIFPKELIKELKEPCPIDTIMCIELGDFWGWNFSIEYIPSKETGVGCRCNEDSICEIDWEELLHQRKEGLEFAGRLNASLYTSAESFKKKHWGFDKMIQL